MFSQFLRKKAFAVYGTKLQNGLRIVIIVGWKYEKWFTRFGNKIIGKLRQ